MTKRAMDLIVSFVALALFSPLFIILAVLIKLESPGPVFFRQQRLGVNGKLFRIYKLRSMHKDAEERLREDPILYQDYVRNGFKLPEGKDPRVSKVGSFLRKSSLDELPQLINVLTGDMSLVGPRPVIAAELQEYGDLKDEFLSAKPGMTGYWQVSGRSSVQYPERVSVELHYIRNRGLFMDIYILLLTPISVLQSKGAY